MQYSSILWGCTFFPPFFLKLFGIFHKKKVANPANPGESAKFAMKHLSFAFRDNGSPSDKATTTGPGIEGKFTLRHPWNIMTCLVACTTYNNNNNKNKFGIEKKGRNYIPQNHGSSKDQNMAILCFFLSGQAVS